jgi:hypothetical protein
MRVKLAFLEPEGPQGGVGKTAEAILRGPMGGAAHGFVLGSGFHVPRLKINPLGEICRGWEEAPGSTGASPKLDIETLAEPVPTPVKFKTKRNPVSVQVYPKWTYFGIDTTVNSVVTTLKKINEPRTVPLFVEAIDMRRGNEITLIPLWESLFETAARSEYMNLHDPKGVIRALKAGNDVAVMFENRTFRTRDFCVPGDGSWKWDGNEWISEALSS